MALSSKTDLEKARAALGDWLGAKVTDISRPAAGGYSNETILFTAGGEGLVARLEPDGPGLYPNYDITTQARLVQILGEHSALSVPRVVGIEPDAGVLGTPFYVMERVDGRVPGDDPPFTMAGWVLELSESERATMYDNALAVLAEVRAVDTDGLDFLAHPELGDDPLSQQIAYYRSYYEWGSEGEPVQAIDDGFAWLESHRPRSPEPVVLSWGDARMGNMIFDDEMRVAAVLDWEMAWLGSPEVDLGWWVFFDRYYSDGIGASLPSGFPSREASIARYVGLTGAEPQHLDFYEAFAAFRGAVIALRLSKMMIAGGILPADSDMATNNPAVHTMSGLMGLEGETQAGWGFTRG
jgi:aminoglycoside phosphotransferase (APT) family kinase protein